MLILFVWLIILWRHLAARNVGRRLHADATIWVLGLELLLGLILLLLVVLLLDSGGTTAVCEVVMHYLTPFSLGLNGSSTRSDNEVLLTILLFLEANVLHTSSILTKVVRVLAIHTSTKRVNHPSWLPSAHQGIKPRIPTRVNSRRSFETLCPLIALVEVIFILEFILAFNAISASGWRSLVHWAIYPYERVGSRLEIVTLTGGESHAATSSNLRLSTSLSIVFILGQTSVRQCIKRCIILVNYRLAVPHRALVSLSEAVDHHVIALHLIWHNAGGTCSVCSLLVIRRV